MDGPVESRAQLLALLRGYRISQAIYVVTQLGIPDLLADGPREIDELARATAGGVTRFSGRCGLPSAIREVRRAGIAVRVTPQRTGITAEEELISRPKPSDRVPHPPNNCRRVHAE